MDCRTCPNCGFDLKTLKNVRLGSLFIRGGTDVFWNEQRVILTPARTLLLLALVRAGGVRLSNAALGAAIGYEGDRLVQILSTQVCYLRRAFRRVDPAFDMIERGQPGGNMGTRWRVEPGLRLVA